jgi:hypothetical protein
MMLDEEVEAEEEKEESNMTAAQRVLKTMRGLV